MVPLFKKGDPRVCSNYQGLTLLSFRWKIDSRMLEREVWLLVKLRIQKEQCGFHPGRGALNKLYTIAMVLEGAWDFANQSKCVLWIWRRLMTVSLKM